MAYIRVSKNREGNEYVYLVEGYRVKDKVRSRVIKKFGLLNDLVKEEPGILDRLKQEAKAGLLNDDEPSQIVVKYKIDEQLSFELFNYGWLFLNEVYNSLGISEVIYNHSQSKKYTYDLNKVLKLLVFQRLLNPCSKTATINSQNKLYGDWNVTNNHMDRGLDHLFELKEDIQIAMHDNISEKVGRSATLVFYDVTNYYFETDIDDTEILSEEGEIVSEGMRRRGPSKEHRPKPIIQMGLFIDSNGIPISYQLFPGNQTDPITYTKAIEQVKKQFGISKIVTVADKAMNSKKNVSDAYRKGDGWVFSSKVRGTRGVSKEIQEFALNADGWEYNSNFTFAKKSMIRERTLENGVIVKEKIVVTWNEKYAIREMIRREGSISYIEKLRQPELYRASCKKSGKKYLEIKGINKNSEEITEVDLQIDIDYDRILDDSLYDGLNVLVTSELHMSDDEIIASYGELFKIEDCFRITKTNLEARPVYVWTKEHIEAHFLTCFISLTIMKLIQHKIEHKLSPMRIINGLNSAVTSELAQGYYKAHGNDDFKELNELCNIDWKASNIKHEILNKYGKGWFTTK